MPEAVANFHAYQQSPEAWMLGRFVLPVARLDEFEQCFSGGPAPRLSALSSGDLEADLARIARARCPIDTLELKASDPAQIDCAMPRIPAAITAYFEITDLALLPLLRASGARAKIRTGGITPEAFPNAQFIAGFLTACAKAATPFKATAGLHHPLRCFGPLTYSTGGPSGWMFGFLNVFLAAVLAQQGVTPEDLVALLLEESISAISFDRESIAWKDYVLTLAAIAEARREFAISFGSCSFEEPVNDLKSLHLL